MQFEGNPLLTGDWLQEWQVAILC